jgi:hypothetical protein
MVVKPDPQQPGLLRGFPGRFVGLLRVCGLFSTDAEQRDQP